MAFTKGDRVTVASPIGSDCEFRGRSGQFINYTQAHGYARIRLDNGHIVLVHPESLTQATKPRPSYNLTQERYEQTWREKQQLR